MTEEDKNKKPKITIPTKKNQAYNQPKIPKPNTKGFGGSSVVRRTGRGR